MVCLNNLQPVLTRSPQRWSSSQPSEIRLFCDLDGPLIDVSERYYQTYLLGLTATQTFFREQRQPTAIAPLSKAQFWALKQSRTPDTEIALRSGLSLSQLEFFLAQVHQTVNQSALLEFDQLQPDVSWSLALLHRWGIRLTVVTLRCQAQAEQVLQRFGIAHFFESIQGTQDCLAAYRNYAEQKQAMLAALIAQEAYPDLEKMWMIGDTEADILAGQGIGIATIALTCGIRSPEYLHQLQPTHIHHNLLAATHHLLNLFRN